MADSQVPWGVDALGGTISEPAWRSKPSWYLVTTEDRMIPPDGTADDVRAHRRDRGRGRRQPLRLRLPTRCRRRPDQASGSRHSEGRRNRRLTPPTHPFALLRSPGSAKALGGCQRRFRGHSCTLGHANSLTPCLPRTRDFIWSARLLGEHLPRVRLRSPACEALGRGPLDGEGSSSSSLGDHSCETGEPLPLVAG